MSFSLHDATVRPFIQTLGAVAGLVDKAEAHCGGGGHAPATLIGACLAPDMFPFAYQVKSTASHSIGAIEGVRAGLFAPDLNPPPDSFTGLRDMVLGARAALEALDPAEVNGFIGRDMAFRFKDFRLDFTAEDFLMSFSLPNFYFHAATAYGILRNNGLAVGKRDFMGAMRTKG